MNAHSVPGTKTRRQKKAAGTSSMLSLAALRTCRHPLIASLPIKIQQIHLFSQFLLLTKLGLPFLFRFLMVPV